jgi:ADP-ribose pyrophosphatase
MPDGRIMESYYVFEYPNWVNVIAIDKQGKFVMVKQYRHALGQVNYELSAGVCDETDQTPLETAKRELLEETGYGRGEWSFWMAISANPGTHTNLCYCYLAENVELIAKQELDASEDISVHLLSKKKLMALLEADQIPQALHAAALWKYLYKNSDSD